MSLTGTTFTDKIAEGGNGDYGGFGEARAAPEPRGGSGSVVGEDGGQSGDVGKGGNGDNGGVGGNSVSAEGIYVSAGTLTVEGSNFDRNLALGGVGDATGTGGIFYYTGLGAD